MYAARKAQRNQVVVARMNSSGTFTCNGLILAVAMCFAMLALFIQNSGNSLAECQEQALAVESRQQKDKDLTETIDYLEKLDKYFSQIARPRFGRSSGGLDFAKRPLMSRFSGQPSMRGSFSGSGGGGGVEPIQFESLLELVNNRLAKKYRDSMNY